MTHERIREANVSHGQCVLKQKCISRNGWRKRRHGAQKKKEKEERKKTNKQKQIWEAARRIYTSMKQ